MISQKIARAALSRSRHWSSAAVVILMVSGCAMDSNLRHVSESVSSVAVGEPGEVSAMALARAMIRSGFSREEILEMGPGIRRSVARTGGAQARRKGEVVALFSHKDAKLYVTSGVSGTFVIDV